ADRDEGLLEGADVGHDVDRDGELDERVADELSGAVPGDPAATVHVDHRGAVGRTVLRSGALAGRVDGRVAQQQEGVRPGPIGPGGGNGALQVPGGDIVDLTQPFDDQGYGAVTHGCHGTRRRRRR